MNSLFLMVRRSLRQHLLSTLVTILSSALASGLVMAVFALATQSERAFTGVPSGFNAVLGARGSPLQLVLNTVFHLETSPGNIPWAMYEEVKKNPAVELAVPYALGDNYLGYRVVGTTLEYFEKVQYRDGESFRVEEGGDFFRPDLMEAVVGSYVSDQAGLKVGSLFRPYHGTVFDAAAEHVEQYRVVGVLEPTNSPNDRVIWIPIDGVFRMGGHALRGSGETYEAKDGEQIPDKHKEVSAVMLKLTGGRAGMQLSQRINHRGKTATLAWPIGTVMADFFHKISWMNRVLEVVAYLVVVVAGAAILASIYNSISERQREFAILRALGARRATVFGAILLESATIAALGSLCGYLIYAVILAGAAAIIREQTGVAIKAFELHPALWWTPVGMILVGAGAGVLPAFKAYSTDVATNLVPNA